jgi:hypothetical protein
LYFYTKKYTILGKLTIDETQIICELSGQNQVFLYENIISLTLERGSTWHIEYQKDNQLVEADNWIEIETHRENFKYEFLIVSLKNNLEFEQMIPLLRKKVANLVLNQYKVKKIFQK